MADERAGSCKEANPSVSLGPFRVSFGSSQHLSHQPEPSQAAPRDWGANGFQVLQQGLERSTGKALPPSHPCPS